MKNGFNQKNLRNLEAINIKGSPKAASSTNPAMAAGYSSNKSKSANADYSMGGVHTSLDGVQSIVSKLSDIENAIKAQTSAVIVNSEINVSEKSSSVISRALKPTLGMIKDSINNALISTELNRGRIKSGEMSTASLKKQFGDREFQNLRLFSSAVKTSMSEVAAFRRNSAQISAGVRTTDEQKVKLLAALVDINRYQGQELISIRNSLQQNGSGGNDFDGVSTSSIGIASSGFFKGLKALLNPIETFYNKPKLFLEKLKANNSGELSPVELLKKAGLHVTEQNKAFTFLGNIYPDIVQESNAIMNRQLHVQEQMFGVMSDIKVLLGGKGSSLKPSNIQSQKYDALTGEFVSENEFANRRAERELMIKNAQENNKTFMQKILTTKTGRERELSNASDALSNNRKEAYTTGRAAIEFKEKRKKEADIILNSIKIADALGLDPHEKIAAAQLKMNEAKSKAISFAKESASGLISNFQNSSFKNKKFNDISDLINDFVSNKEGVQSSTKNLQSNVISTIAKKKNIRVKKQANGPDIIVDSAEPTSKATDTISSIIDSVLNATSEIKNTRGKINNTLKYTKKAKEQALKYFDIIKNPRAKIEEKIKASAKLAQLGIKVPPEIWNKSIGVKNSIIGTASTIGKTASETRDNLGKLAEGHETAEAILAKADQATNTVRDAGSAVYTRGSKLLGSFFKSKDKELYGPPEPTASNTLFKNSVVNDDVRSGDTVKVNVSSALDTVSGLLNSAKEKAMSGYDTVSGKIHAGFGAVSKNKSSDSPPNKSDISKEVGDESAINVRVIDFNKNALKQMGSVASSGGMLSDAYTIAKDLSSKGANAINDYEESKGKSIFEMAKEKVEAGYDVVSKKINHNIEDGIYGPPEPSMMDNLKSKSTYIANSVKSKMKDISESNKNSSSSLVGSHPDILNEIKEEIIDAHKSIKKGNVILSNGIDDIIAAILGKYKGKGSGGKTDRSGRRGFFGKAIDTVTGAFGLVGKTIKKTLSIAKSIITAPFKALSWAVGRIKDGIAFAAKGIFEAGKAIISGAAKATGWLIKNAVIGAGKLAVGLTKGLFKGALFAMESAVKIMGSVMTGTIKVAGAALTAAVNVTSATITGAIKIASVAINATLSTATSLLTAGIKVGETAMKAVVGVGAKIISTGAGLVSKAVMGIMGYGKKGKGLSSDTLAIIEAVHSVRDAVLSKTDKIINIISGNFNESESYSNMDSNYGTSKKQSLFSKTADSIRSKSDNIANRASKVGDKAKSNISSGSNSIRDMIRDGSASILDSMPNLPKFTNSRISGFASKIKKGIKTVSNVADDKNSSLFQKMFFRKKEKRETESLKTDKDSNGTLHDILKVLKVNGVGAKDGSEGKGKPGWLSKIGGLVSGLVGSVGPITVAIGAIGAIGYGLKKFNDFVFGGPSTGPDGNETGGTGTKAIIAESLAAKLVGDSLLNKKAIKSTASLSRMEKITKHINKLKTAGKGIKSASAAGIGSKLLKGTGSVLKGAAGYGLRLAGRIATPLTAIVGGYEGYKNKRDIVNDKGEIEKESTSSAITHGVFGADKTETALGAAVSTGLKYAAYGGSIGTFFGPGIGTAIGAGVGGLIGAGVGYFGHNSDNKNEAKVDAIRKKQMANPVLMAELAKNGKIPRGVRNNNPTNMELNNIKWNGLSDSQTDGRFAQFKTPSAGIRAAGKNLRSAHTLHNRNTIREIINRWSPASENGSASTDAYVDAVSKDVGIDSDSPIDFKKDGNKIVKAIIHHENGMNAYTDDMINQSLDGIFQKYKQSEQSHVLVASNDSVTGLLSDAADTSDKIKTQDELLHNSMIAGSAIMSAPMLQSATSVIKSKKTKPISARHKRFQAKKASALSRIKSTKTAGVLSSIKSSKPAVGALARLAPALELASKFEGPLSAAINIGTRLYNPAEHVDGHGKIQKDSIGSSILRGALGSNRADSYLGAAASTALKYGTYGAFLGPWGALGGAALGGIVGGVGHYFDNKRKLKVQQARDLILKNKMHPVRQSINVGGDRVFSDLGQRNINIDDKLKDVFDNIKDNKIGSNDDILKELQKLNKTNEELTASLAVVAMKGNKSTTVVAPPAQQQVQTKHETLMPKSVGEHIDHLYEAKPLSEMAFRHAGIQP